MSNAQAERAINQLYESDAVRSELRDEEASLLLTWGEARLVELADRNLSDEQFDAHSAKLRTLLSAINFCVGRRKTMPSQHLNMMAEIGSAAESAGFKLVPEEQTGFLRAQGVLSNDEAIAELLGLLKPETALQPVEETPVAAQAVEVHNTPPESPAPLPALHVPVVTQHPPIVEPGLSGTLLPINDLSPTQQPSLPDMPLNDPHPAPEPDAPQPDAPAPSLPDSETNVQPPPPPDDLPEFPMQPPQEN